MISSFRTLLVSVILVAYMVVLGPPALLVAWLSGSGRILFVLGLPAVRLGLWLAGVRIRVVGRDHLERTQTYLFMPNHQSNVDAPVILLVLGRDVRMMAKAQLFRIPLLGQALWLAGFVPVVREERERAIEAVEAAASWLRKGRDFAVFPEGTRSRDGRLLPLKKGPFFMAINAQVPVVPVVIRGSSGLLPKGGRRILPGEVEVEILEPIPTAGLSLQQRDELRAAVRRSLRKGLADEGESKADGVDSDPADATLTVPPASV